MFVKQSLKSCFLYLVLLGAVPGLTGCGGAAGDVKQRAEISVTVTHDGTPVSDAELRLMMVGQGEGAMGLLDEAGKVELSDVVLGSYTVVVSPPEGTPDNPAPKKEYPNIPKQYRSLKQSPLKADVTSGENEFTFDLK